MKRVLAAWLGCCALVLTVPALASPAGRRAAMGAIASCSSRSRPPRCRTLGRATGCRSSAWTRLRSRCSTSSSTAGCPRTAMVCPARPRCDAGRAQASSGSTACASTWPARGSSGSCSPTATASTERPSRSRSVLQRRASRRARGSGAAPSVRPYARSRSRASASFLPIPRTGSPTILGRSRSDIGSSSTRRSARTGRSAARHATIRAGCSATASELPTAWQRARATRRASWAPHMRAGSSGTGAATACGRRRSVRSKRRRR